MLFLFFLNFHSSKQPSPLNLYSPHYFTFSAFRPYHLVFSFHIHTFPSRYLQFFFHFISQCFSDIFSSSQTVSSGTLFYKNVTNVFFFFLKTMKFFQNFENHKKGKKGLIAVSKHEKHNYKSKI